MPPDLTPRPGFRVRLTAPAEDRGEGRPPTGLSHGRRPAGQTVLAAKARRLLRPTDLPAAGVSADRASVTARRGGR